jgi:hypothetical protein
LTTEVSTGRPDGRHQIFHGRHLIRQQWPTQRNHFGLGDIRSHGFVAAPGALHPSGRRYKLTRPMQPARWDPAWTVALDEAWKAAGRGTGSREGTRGSEGTGRNCELYDLKKSLFSTTPWPGTTAALAPIRRHFSMPSKNSPTDSACNAQTTPTS